MSLHPDPRPPARPRPPRVRRPSHRVSSPSPPLQDSTHPRPAISRLDETEQARPVPIYLQNKPTLPEGARIRFRGVLTIDALSQLTLEAIDAISAALQMRQTEAQINGVVGARGDYFKPQVLYSDRGRARQGTPRIKVLIQGVKHMPFVYLACESSRSSCCASPVRSAPQPSSYRTGFRCTQRISESGP